MKIGKFGKFDFKNPRSFIPFILLAIAILLVLTFGVREKSPHLKGAMETRLEVHMESKERLFSGPGEETAAEEPPTE